MNGKNVPRPPVVTTHPIPCRRAAFSTRPRCGCPLHHCSPRGPNRESRPQKKGPPLPGASTPQNAPRKRPIVPPPTGTFWKPAAQDCRSRRHRARAAKTRPAARIRKDEAFRGNPRAGPRTPRRPRQLPHPPRTRTSSRFISARTSSCRTLLHGDAKRCPCFPTSPTST